MRDSYAKLIRIFVKIRGQVVKEADIILVGQGIAGSVLAMELLREGKRVVVIDNPALSNCSRAAAGIYNPVVFKRLTQSWMAEQVLPEMLGFFGELEQKNNCKLIHPIKIARLFDQEDEEALWKKKAVNELSDLIDPNIYSGLLDHPYGIVKESGYVDVPVFLELCRKGLLQSNSLLEETFDAGLLQVKEVGVVYKDISAPRLIFCEGHLYKTNPWFSYLGFKPAKGEVLTIYCEGLRAEMIINKDIFILPLDKPQHFKVGATYNWQDLSDEITPEAKRALEEKLKSLLPYPYEVVKQEAGVRPATADRRPVMGFHPQHQQLGIFNGFGTKAVLLAPYFAKHFCSFIQNKTPLWHEVDVKRFGPANNQ